MLDEGRDAIFERHHRIGDYVRWRAKEMGLQLARRPRQCLEHSHSHSDTRRHQREGAAENSCAKQDKVVLAGGQDHLDGKIMRVGHLGFFEEADLVEAMDKLETRLREAGFQG